jgi:hypothetical protein
MCPSTFRSRCGESSCPLSVAPLLATVTCFPCTGAKKAARKRTGRSSIRLPGKMGTVRAGLRPSRGSLGTYVTPTCDLDAQKGDILFWKRNPRNDIYCEEIGTAVGSKGPLNLTRTASQYVGRYRNGTNAWPTRLCRENVGRILFYVAVGRYRGSFMMGEGDASGLSRPEFARRRRKTGHLRQ